MAVGAGGEIRSLVDKDLSRYDRNASIYFWVHHLLKVVIALAAVLVAVLVGRSPATPNDILIVLGIVVAGGEALTAVWNTGEKWLRYRSAAEALRNELRWFDAKVGEYDETPQKAEGILKTRWRRAIENEVKGWTASATEEKGQR